MAGDQFSVRVSSWYQLNGVLHPVHLRKPPDGYPCTPNCRSGDCLQFRRPGISCASRITALSFSSNVLDFVQDTGSVINSSIPHAFINWILLDNEFNYIAASSGFSQVGNSGQLKITTLNNLSITSSGYLYIYTSNETPNVDVFFDNLQVTHTRGPLLEEDHYYPFGLLMPNLTDLAMKNVYSENKYRFSDKELQNKEFKDGSGLDCYDMHFRVQDPQIGRFWQIDPLTTSYPSTSNYSYAEDKVTAGIDLEGLELLPFNTAWFTESGSYTMRQVNGKDALVYNAQLSIVASNLPKIYKDKNGNPLFTPAAVRIGPDGDIPDDGQAHLTAPNMMPENPAWPWAEELPDPDPTPSTAGVNWKS